MVEAGNRFHAEDAGRVQCPGSHTRIRFCRVLGLLEGHREMALRGQIVNFVRLHLLDNTEQAAGVGHVPVVQHKVAAFDLRALVGMVDAVAVKQRGAAVQAVQLVALAQQEFRQIGTVLNDDPSY